MRTDQTKFINFYKLLLVLFSVFFVVSILSTFYFQQIFAEATITMFLILNEGSLSSFLNAPYFRFSTLILRMPAILGSLTDLPAYIVTWLYCITYAIYPAAALVVLHKIYKNTKVILFLPAFIITFFVAMVPSWTFSMAVTGESIVLSWFLVAYILGVEKVVWWKLGLLCIPILFSYEAGIIFLILALYILIREKKFNWPSFVVLLCFFGSFASYFIFFIIPQKLHLSVDNAGVFLKSPSFHWLLPTLLLASIHFTRSSKFQTLLIGASLVVSTCLLYQTYQFGIETHNWTSHANRVWAIPAAFIILISLYEVFRRNGEKFQNYRLAIFCILAIPGITFETHSLYNHRLFLHKIEQQMSKKPGCSVLTEPEFQILTQNAWQPNWTLPFLSLVLNYSYTPTSILNTDLYGNDPHTPLPNNFCRLDDQRNFVSNIGISILRIPTYQKVNFTKIFPISE